MDLTYGGSEHCDNLLYDDVLSLKTSAWYLKPRYIKRCNVHNENDRGVVLLATSSSGQVRLSTKDNLFFSIRTPDKYLSISEFYSRYRKF